MEEYLDRLAVVDILNWVRDNMGMEIALFIIVLAVLVAVPSWVVCYFWKAKAPSGNKPKQTTEAVSLPVMPNINGPAAIGNHNVINITTKGVRTPEPSAPPEHRAWRELMSETERIEQAAGFRAAGPIYYTPGPYPRFYIVHASARVFRPGGEEYYDAKGNHQHILLQHDAPGDLPYRVRPHGLTDLEALYKRAADSNANCD